MSMTNNGYYRSIWVEKLRLYIASGIICACQDGVGDCFAVLAKTKYINVD